MATGTAQGQAFGTIQSVSGQAKIIGVDGSARAVVAGGKIFNNEMILTTANAAVKVQLSNGQIVNITPGSEYQVGVDAAPGAGGADEGGGGSAAVVDQGAPGANVTAGFLTEPVGGRVIGTVTDTSGQATATAPDGSVRILGIGDKVFANETVSSSSGGPVNISLAGGGSLECGPGAQLTLNPNLLSVGKPASGIADIQQAILAGADPTQVADPTAAGAPAVGSPGTELEFAL